jgi:hypothetical protein
VTWQRRLAPPILGAGVAAAIASVVGALTHPYAEKANEAYREGAQTGLVARYATLGALLVWLLDVLVNAARRHGSLGAALATRGLPLLAAVGLVAVLALMIVPPFVGNYDRSDRLRDEHAGFVDGCTNNAPRASCECVWKRLVADPRADSSAERRAIFEQIGVTGRAPPPLRKAAAGCGP